MRLTKEQILERMPSLNPNKDLVAMWYGDIPGRTYDAAWHEDWKKLTGTLSNISATKAFIYEVYGEFDTYSTFIGDVHISRDGKVLAGDVKVKYRGDTYDIYLNEMYGWHALDILRIGQTVTGFSNEDGMGSPSLNTKEMSMDLIEAVINQPLDDYGYGIQRLMEIIRATYNADPTNHIMEKLKSFRRLDCMDGLTMIAKLLGGENEKRLKDEITDILIRQVERDIEDKYKYEYILAFDCLYEEVKVEMEKEFKDRLAKKYREQMDKKLAEMFSE